LYTPGKLIFFDPFYFKNGSASKPKYFLVLKIIDGTAILASLPTSKSHLPANQKIVHGCLEIPDSCINCYVFESNKAITKDGWAFGLDTFLHGVWIDDFSISELEASYVIENVDYEIIGELTDAELQNVIDCFRNSSSVKRRYKKLLNQIT
jgi:hypothetical protein